LIAFIGSSSQRLSDARVFRIFGPIDFVPDIGGGQAFVVNDFAEFGQADFAVHHLAE